MIITFACNTKSFSIVILVFSFSFSFSPPFLDRLAKVFCGKAMGRYPRHVRPGLDLSLQGTPANFFVYVLLIVILETSGQYLFDMRVQFKRRLGTVPDALLVGKLSLKLSFIVYVLKTPVYGAVRSYS